MLAFILAIADVKVSIVCGQQEFVIGNMKVVGL